MSNGSFRLQNLMYERREVSDAEWSILEPVLLNNIERSHRGRHDMFPLGSFGPASRPN